MSEEWKTETLEELCDFRNGLWKGKKPPYVEVGIIRNTNFTKDGFLDDSDIAYHDVEVKQFEKRRLEYGDLILEKSGGGPKQPVGRVIPFEMEEGEFSFSNFTSVIRIKDKAKLDFQFLHRCLLHYYISGVTETMQRRSTGIRNLDFKTYKQLQIPTPPKAEQKRIVAILDEAFGAIAKAKRIAEKNLSNAIELFDSYLNRVFSKLWDSNEIVTMADLATSITDGDHNAPPKSETGLPFITISNIDKSTRKIDFKDTFKVPRQYVDGLNPTRKPRRNDVLYTVTGSFGIPVLVDHDDEFCFQRHIGLIRPRENVDSKWLYYLCLTPQIFGQASERATGTAQKTVSLKVLRTLKVPNVRHEDQITVVPLLEKASQESAQLKRLYQRKLIALDELKQSILQKAFTGQLTNKSPELEAVP